VRSEDYLATVKAAIIGNPQIITWRVLREESQGDAGLYRYRVTWRDGSQLEMFERFDINGDVCEVTKYSFQWQDAAANLRKRWDCAAHHLEVTAHPHHVHDGVTGQILPGEPTNATAILAYLSAWLEEPKQLS
jgi:hypothetical protein